MSVVLREMNDVKEDFREVATPFSAFPKDCSNQKLKLEASHCANCELDDCEPVAVGEDFEYQTVPDSFLYVRCQHCGLLYLNPRPAASEFKSIYPASYHAYQFQEKKQGLVFRVRRWLDARRFHRWCKGLPADARILDIGCGDGFHLRILADYGSPDWQLEGLDSDDTVRRVATSRIRVHQKTVEEFEPTQGCYDLIFLIMTVEHLNEPKETLGRIRGWLKPGGRLVIVTDNAGTPDAWLFGGRHWGGYHFPRHTYLFTRRTLRTLGEKSGFRVQTIRSSVSPVNLVYSVRNWLQDWGAPRWLYERFSLQSPIALGMGTMLDFVLNLFGFGGNLQAVFEVSESAKENV